MTNVDFVWLSNRSSRETTYELEDVAPYTLPGVFCDVCGQHWFGLCVDHPSVTREMLGPFATELQEARNVPWAEYVRLTRELAQRLGPHTLLVPGASFGPSRVRVYGTVPDGIVWGTLGRLFVSRGLREQLSDLLENTLTVPVEFRPKPANGAEYFQIQDSYVTALHPSAYSEGTSCCIQCGRSTARLYPVVDRRAIDDSAEIVRIVGFPGIRLVRTDIIARLRAAGFGMSTSNYFQWR